LSALAPQYLGRKVGAREVTLAVLAFLSMLLGIPEGGAIASTVPQALTAVQDAGHRGINARPACR
jgi:potassium-transporting ATPase potassium-binding subunit